MLSLYPSYYSRYYHSKADIFLQNAPWPKDMDTSLSPAKGSFLGVAAVDIEAKSLGQYPYSNTRGCYAITVDHKGFNIVIGFNL